MSLQSEKFELMPLSFKGKNFQKIQYAGENLEIKLEGNFKIFGCEGVFLSVFHQFQAKTESTDMQFKSKFMKF